MLWRSPNRNVLAALAFSVYICGPAMLPGAALPHWPVGSTWVKAAGLKYCPGRTGPTGTPVYSGRELNPFEPTATQAFPEQEGVSGFPLASLTVVEIVQSLTKWPF